MKKLGIILSLLTTLIACSNKGLYQAGQDYKKNECINSAQTAEEHLRCNNIESKSYEQYEKERKAIVNN
jgi:hypothetical protein